MNKFVNYVSDCLLKETSFNLKDITHPDFKVYTSFRDGVVDVFIIDEMYDLMERKYGANKVLVDTIFNSYIEKVTSIFKEKYNGYIPELTECEQFIYDKLMECELIESEKRKGYTIYLNKDDEILFVDDIDAGVKNPVIYVDCDEIWLKCKKMGVSYEEFQKICVNMLYEIPKRKVSTAWPNRYITQSELYEIPKRKVSTAHCAASISFDPLYEIPKRKVSTAMKGSQIKNLNI